MRSAGSRSMWGALLGGWALAGVMGSACGEGPGDEASVALSSLGASICQRMLECGCVANDEEGQIAKCEFDFGDEFRAHDGQGGAGHLVFDPVCADRWAAWVRSLDCIAPVAVPFARDLCPVYHGAIFEGQSCTLLGSLASDCGPGLYCVVSGGQPIDPQGFEAIGTCVDPHKLAFGGRDQPCDPLAGCNEGLSCIAGVCGSLPGLGAPCIDECADDLTCAAGLDGVSVCARLGEEGTLCTGHAQCASGFCPAGKCAAAPGLGAACGDGVPCAGELACLQGLCTDVSSLSICAAFDPDVGVEGLARALTIDTLRSP